MNTIYAYTGSEKQIAWATEVFEKLFKQLDQFEESVRNLELPEDKKARFLETVSKIRAEHDGTNWFEQYPASTKTYKDCSNFLSVFGYVEKFNFMQMALNGAYPKFNEIDKNIIITIDRKLNK